MGRNSDMVWVWICILNPYPKLDFFGFECMCHGIHFKATNEKLVYAYFSHIQRASDQRVNFHPYLGPIGIQVLKNQKGSLKNYFNLPLPLHEN